MKAFPKKTLATALFLLILSSIFITASTPVSAVPVPPTGKPREYIAALIFQLIGWYNIGSGLSPKYFYADPDVIEIDYLSNTTVDLVWGTEREERRNWHRFQENIFPEFTLRYDAVFPPEIPEDAFRVVFDPATFDVVNYHEEVGGNDVQAQQPTTKMTLYLDLPPDPENTIQDFVLKVNVSIFRKYGDLIDTFGLLVTLFGGFLQANFQADVGHKSFYVFVKVKPFRDAEIYVPEPLELRPMDMKTAQIQVQNRGSHIEQFGFKVSGQKEPLIVNTPQPITLAPGEVRTLDVGFVSKPFAYDRGTLHTVSVDVYPYDEPDNIVARGDLTVWTKGFAVQAVFSFRYSWHIFFIISIIIFLLIMIALFRRIQLLKYLRKPRKPWTLYEEKQFLQKLLKDNKKDEYQKILEQMKSEYLSALLWYKYYKKSVLREQRRKSKLYSLIINPISGVKKVVKKPIIPKKPQKVKTKSKKPTSISLPKIKPKEIIKKPEPKPLTQQDEVLRKIRLQQRKMQKKA